MTETVGEGSKGRSRMVDDRRPSGKITGAVLEEDCESRIGVVAEATAVEKDRAVGGRYALTPGRRGVLWLWTSVPSREENN